MKDSFLGVRGAYLPSKSILAVSSKTKNILKHFNNRTFWAFITEKCSYAYVHCKKLHVKIHSSFSFNSQKLETTQMS